MPNTIENDLDGFWQIALDSTSERRWRDENDSDEDGDEDSARISRYLLPTTSITLQAQPLPATDGIWSPVGAVAWYSSALLATILLEEDEEIGSLFPKHCRKPVILELGSGAVALSGLACAIALGRHFEQATIILTDNDPPVLDQLKVNVDRNQQHFPKHVDIQVQSLDWNDSDSLDSSVLSLDLVIGSELVYTQETATACMDLLVHLLERHPKLKIVIVQVTDRFGWNEIMVPRLESVGARISQLSLSSETHEVASTMIQYGDTLDVSAYGAFVIEQHIDNVETHI
jgi:predicted nicotinamide N-methyase